ncbi:MAG: carbohydrate kinase [Erysipelotrichaceae bacterium]|nr:carbohydrate kinase [Erysipelotrichaceae bacterium]
MKTLCSIGEALIDFIPIEKGKRLKDVVAFKRVAGGAPANVAASVAKLGGKARFLTQLGQDAFGDHILDVLKMCGIDTSHILRTADADTSLAFVSLAHDGNRDFMFYRRNCADLQFCKEDINEHVLDDCSILHFCSVSLVESPMKYTHQKIIEKAIQQGMLISFDPNVRLSLWEDETKCQQTICDFLPYADIIKISDEELEFISGFQKIEDAKEFFFKGRCQWLIYTKGKDGVELFTRDGKHLSIEGYRVNAMDTTGAGDSFIGAFLFKVLQQECMELHQIEEQELLSYLTFANAYAAHTTTKQGAIEAMATMEEITTFKAQLEK